MRKILEFLKREWIGCLLFILPILFVGGIFAQTTVVGDWEIRGNDAVYTGGQVLLDDGSAAVPAYSFIGDADNGMFVISADRWGFSVAGSSVQEFETTAVTVRKPLYQMDGTALAPVYGFANDPDTGLYKSGLDTIDFSVGGVQRLQIKESIMFVDSGGKPTCAVGYRGMRWHDFGAASVKDTVEVCAKDAADAYAWRTIY